MGIGAMPKEAETVPLPLGSVVTLKEAARPVAIIGRKMKVVATGVIYDYGAVLYPEGYIDREHILLFDYEAIERLLFIGHLSAEEIAFSRQLR